MDCSPPGSLSVQFSRQEYWSGLPFPSPGNLPNPGIKPGSNGCPLFQPSDVVATPPPSFCTTLAKGEAGIFLALLCFLQRELWPFLNYLSFYYSALNHHYIYLYYTCYISPGLLQQYPNWSLCFFFCPTSLFSTQEQEWYFQNLRQPVPLPEAGTRIANTSPFKTLESIPRKILSQPQNTTRYDSLLRLGFHLL